jgi:hypothetical protein
MRRMAWTVLVVLGGLLVAPQLASAGHDAPRSLPPDSVPPEETAPSTTAPGQLPPAAGPLVPSSPECVVPPSASAVFRGVIELVDDPARPSTYRFRVQSLLAGSLEGYEVGGQVDIRYGDEAKFLEVGTMYLVGVSPDPETGLLTSKVREPAPLFGGDAVIGADDSDINCPRVNDPVRTLLVDGGSVDTGVLTPLKEEGSSLLMAVLRPLAVAFGVLVALVLLKQLLFAVGRSLRDIGSDQTPRPRPRERRHRAPSATSGLAE